LAGGSELFELVRALLEKEERKRKERALAARIRMAKEAVRHGRGRASRTALAGGVRGELGHGDDARERERAGNTRLDIFDQFVSDLNLQIFV